MDPIRILLASMRRLAEASRPLAPLGLLALGAALAWTAYKYVSVRELTEYESIIIALSVFFALIGISMASIVFRKSGMDLPIARNIAIVGFPQSGKTTLIISLFGEMFAGRVNLPIAPKGSSTIKRVNEGLAALKTGRPIGPTTSQDRFSFRADVTVKAFPFSRIYKVEFGDFPGDESKDLLAEHEDWLHDTEFFSWVLESDALVFVVDVGKYMLDSKGYSAYMSKAIRAAWQAFCEANSDKRTRLARFPVILAFTKTDLLVRSLISGETEETQRRVMDVGFGGSLPDEIPIDPEHFTESMAAVMLDFGDLLNYFTGQTEKFRAIPLSAFGRDQAGILLGFDKFIKSLLP